MNFELPITDPIMQFTLLITAVLLIQLTLKWLHMPSLVGLLVIGMLIGPDGFSILPRGPVIELL